MPHIRTKPRKATLLGLVTFTAAAALLAGCTGGEVASGPNVIDPSEVTNDQDATVVVWTDPSRLPGFEAYQEQNPDVKMEIVTVDNAQTLQKIQLANRSGSGFPDVLYPLSVDYFPLLSSEEYEFFAQPLDGLYDDELLEGFGTTLDACTIDGHLYCLRNDLAPAVLYYNTEKMEEFGYEVPTTMEEYLELGLTVAEEHPGHFVQAPIGGSGNTLVGNFYTSSGCPFDDVQDGGTVHIDWSDPKCTRVTELVDQLIEAGAISTDQYNEAQNLELGSTGQLLMSINAVWYGDYVWGGGYGWPEGTLGIAPTPEWESGTSLAGNEGGGGYMISRHSENMEAALDIVRFMSSEPDYQLTAGTFPAYEPLQEQWLADRLPANPLYAPGSLEDVAAVYKEAAASINPKEWTKIDNVAAFDDAALAGIRNGETIASQIEAIQTTFENVAKQKGYQLAE